MGAAWVAQVRKCSFILYTKFNYCATGQKEVRDIRSGLAYECADRAIFHRFMARTLAIEFFDFADEADEPEATCPVCQDCE